jgi:Leucine Rich repeat
MFTNYLVSRNLKSYPLEANTTFSDSLILAISRTCHLYTSICFKSFVKYEDFLKMVNSNRLHVTLDLTNNESDMHALLKGYDIGELSKVNRLIFARNKMVKIDLFNLSYALRGASRLESIDLTSCHFNGDFNLLSSVLKESNLKELLVGNNELGAWGCGDISQLLQASPIKILDISCGSCNDAGVACIALALADSKLHTLSVINNGITDVGCILLANALSTSCITTLDISENSITDDGCEAISRALATSKLTHLDLSYNEITDVGVTLLASTLKGSCLTSLEILENWYSEFGTAALFRGLKDSNMTELHVAVNGMEFGRELCETLMECLPNAQLQVLTLPELAMSATVDDVPLDVFIQSIMPDMKLSFYGT